ncbi:MAG: hypothetical protein GXN93_03210 [Candidatus Diapherotrites archaeon]|nr:hypothetical protein [Candidatus Diapherotrites archaeon]
MSTYYTLDRWIALLQDMARQGGDFLTLQGLRQLTGLSEGAVRKAVARLEKKGFLLRVGPGLYANRFGHPTLEALAMIIGAPCYISFESALERYGILSQIPLVLTCASTSRSGLRQTPLGEVVFHRLHPRLFFGYRSEDGILWAEPEKALLDWIYLHRKRYGMTPALDELTLDDVDWKRLREWSRLYPRPVQAVVEDLMLQKQQTLVSV